MNRPLVRWQKESDFSRLATALDMLPEPAVVHDMSYTISAHTADLTCPGTRLQWHICVSPELLVHNSRKVINSFPKSRLLEPPYVPGWPILNEMGPAAPTSVLGGDSAIVEDETTEVPSWILRFKRYTRISLACTFGGYVRFQV